jgi:hypothetical protein
MSLFYLSQSHGDIFQVINEFLLVQTNGERLESENKDIKDLEAIEKKEFPSTEKVRLHTYIH